MKRRRAVLSSDSEESSDDEPAEPLLDAAGVRDAAAVLRQAGATPQALLGRLRLLGRFPMTVAVLAETGVAKALKPLRTHGDAAVARLASALFSRWKATAKASAAAAPAPAPAPAPAAATAPAPAAPPAAAAPPCPPTLSPAEALRKLLNAKPRPAAQRQAAQRRVYDTMVARCFRR